MSGITKRSFANSRAVQLISANIRKCDRVDARMLARIARADPKLLSPIRHRDHHSYPRQARRNYVWSFPLAGKASKFPANYRMPRLDKVGFHCRSMAPKGATAAVPVFHFPACQLLSAKLQKISGSARL